MAIADIQQTPSIATRMPSFNPLIALAFSIAPLIVFAQQSESERTEPAGLLLLVLGIGALIMGLRGLRNLRTKHFMPPRNARRRRR